MLGKDDGDTLGKDDGDMLGADVGDLLGEEDGRILGTTEGTNEGHLLGSEDGRDDGIAVGKAVGDLVSGVYFAKHMIHAFSTSCSPTTSAYTVSGVVWSVSESTHWSSWVIILAPVVVRAKTRNPVLSVRLVEVPIAP
jgi:hypothetical protein